jgi:hypothetical protein
MNILDRIPAKITKLARRGADENSAGVAPYEIAVFSLHESEEESNECPLPAASGHPLLRYLHWVRDALPHILHRRWTGGDSEVLLFDLEAHSSLVAPRWPLSLKEASSS